MDEFTPTWCVVARVFKGYYPKDQYVTKFFWRKTGADEYAEVIQAKNLPVVVKTENFKVYIALQGGEHLGV